MVGQNSKGKNHWRKAIHTKPLVEGDYIYLTEVLSTEPNDIAKLTKIPLWNQYAIQRDKEKCKRIRKDNKFLNVINGGFHQKVCGHKRPIARAVFDSENRYTSKIMESIGKQLLNPAFGIGSEYAFNGSVSGGYKEHRADRLGGFWCKYQSPKETREFVKILAETVAIMGGGVWKLVKLYRYEGTGFHRVTMETFIIRKFA
jgi:hypothetical protein